MNVFPRAFARMLEDSYFHCKRFAEAKTISSSSESLSPLLDNTTELRFSARFSLTLRKENTFSLVTQLCSPLSCRYLCRCTAARHRCEWFKWFSSHFKVLGRVVVSSCVFESMNSLFIYSSNESFIHFATLQLRYHSS